MRRESYLCGPKMKIHLHVSASDDKKHGCYSGLSANPHVPCPRLFSRISGWAGQQRMEGNQQPSRRSALQVPTSPQPCCSPGEHQGRHYEFIQGWIHLANPWFQRGTHRKNNITSEVTFFGGLSIFVPSIMNRYPRDSHQLPPTEMWFNIKPAVLCSVHHCPFTFQGVAVSA